MIELSNKQCIQHERSILNMNLGNRINLETVKASNLGRRLPPRPPEATGNLPSIVKPQDPLQSEQQLPRISPRAADDAVEERDIVIVNPERSSSERLDDVEEIKAEPTQHDAKEKRDQEEKQRSSIRRTVSPSKPPKSLLKSIPPRSSKVSKELTEEASALEISGDNLSTYAVTSPPNKPLPPLPLNISRIRKTPEDSPKERSARGRVSRQLTRTRASILPRPLKGSTIKSLEELPVLSTSSDQISPTRAESESPKKSLQSPTRVFSQWNRPHMQNTTIDVSLQDLEKVLFDLEAERNQEKK